MITEDILQQTMPNLKRDKCEAYFPFVQEAMDEFEINTPLREAAFLAQIAHESGQFQFMEEIWGPTEAQKHYEPPASKARELGNTQPGDGKRFKGRGPIQVTGRANYQKYGDLLGLDLVGQPELASTAAVGFRIAGAFWKTHGLNELADAEDFEEITRRINGGLLGLKERVMFYNQAKTALGV